MLLERRCSFYFSFFLQLINNLISGFLFSLLNTRCANTNSKYDYCLKQIASLKERLINDTESIHRSSIIAESERRSASSIDAMLTKQLDDQNLFIPYNELISELNSPSFWTNVGILISFLLFFRLLGYLVLRFK